MNIKTLGYVCAAVVVAGCASPAVETATPTCRSVAPVPPAPKAPGSSAEASSTEPPASNDQPAASSTGAPLLRVAASVDRDRQYPDHDHRQGLTRSDTGVLLFAPPPAMLGAAGLGLAPLEPVRLLPLLCSKRGTLEVGERCGELMPAQATVRLTGGPDLVARRSATTFVDEAGGHTYPPPFGPACCMYNTCVGHTIPYVGIPRSRAGERLVPTRTLLGVWPRRAELDLRAQIPWAPDDVRLEPVPWAKRRRPAQLVQVLSVDGLRFVSATAGMIEGMLFMESPTGWTSLLDETAWEHHIIATVDVDDDGHTELIVLSRYANNYGLSVIVAGETKPIYRFSCGNV